MFHPHQTVGRPAFTVDAAGLLQALGPTVMPCGNGRSYGDYCLNGGGALVDTHGLNRLLDLDLETGVLEVEAGGQPRHHPAAFDRSGGNVAGTYHQFH